MSGEAITIGFSGTSATSVTLPRNSSVAVEASYGTDTPERTFALDFFAQKSGDVGAGIGSQDPAVEDTTYTQSFAPSSRGTWDVWATITTTDGLQPFINVSSAHLTVIAWANEGTVDAEVETRTATAAAEERTADAPTETRTATAGVEPRAVDASLPSRSVGGGVEG